MKEITFHKMQGAGNDFVVIDNRKYGFALDQIIKITPKLCDRKFGIGGDGILVLQPAQKAEVDFTMIYRNADGSDAGMCGNGARCLVMFAFKNGFNATQTFNVHDNVYEAEVHADNSVSIHFPVHVQPERRTLNGYDLIKADAATEHLVTFIPQEKLEDEKELVSIGSELRYHPEVNPPGSNVNFVCAEDGESIHLQTYERGVEGLTLACGTGALASAIATHFHKQQQEKHATYTVKVKGGTLKASFDFNPDTTTYHQLILTGPAHFVFEGIYTL
ncbi:MAG: diaminopimelate epimerase [Gracilimonas sp.]|uniref:diaminopimelate epimerase n=1 Tax=Gracilimonas TaxID=649462 RepID=UPI001AFF5459|nr:diaminopimelate epimerase [Gracilimonas sp.]MBO6586707.1 diaminopimelate epimerase [Gracilimonas sp.]MBO6615364.1 diaminopimelate epimerase [Gracilimonas sp.]